MFKEAVKKDKVVGKTKVKDINKILLLKKYGLGLTKTTDDESLCNHTYLQDTQNVNSIIVEVIIRNIYFQGCTCFSFCWAHCYLAIAEGFMLYLSRDTWEILKKHFLDKMEWDSIFLHPKGGSIPLIFILFLFLEIILTQSTAH